jgi:hypothetical protein
MRPVAIYFAGSIRGGRENVAFYHDLIELLSEYGEVLTSHVGDTEMSVKGEDGITDKTVYQRDMEWMCRADVLVADVSVPSLGVGYEIARAEMREIPILCLYHAKARRPLSAIVSGNPLLQIVRYRDKEEAGDTVRKFMNRVIYGKM